MITDSLLMPRKRKAPSNAVMVGAGGGGGLGALIAIALNAVGINLPPGLESALGTLAGAAVAYFAPGGRKGDAR
jgi:hypothetical protein